MLLFFRALVYAFCVSIVQSVKDDTCVSPGTCVAPNYKFSAGRNVIPRKQWGNSGGFCGSLSVQAIALSYGAWISQDLVRKAAPPGGGHGNVLQGYEIVHTNIEAALDTLRLSYISWDWEGETQPQGGNYLQWLKGNLVKNNGVVQFVLCKGDAHNSYGTDDAPIPYDHIEPFFKILSNYSLDDLTVHPDDVVVHGSDYAPDGSENNGYFRPFSSLLDNTDMEGNCKSAGDKYGENEMYPCIYDQLTYGYAISGFAGDPDPTSSAVPQTVPVTMYVNTTDEPDIRSGEPPIYLQAQLEVSQLSEGNRYVIYRWDDYKNYPVDGTFATSAYSFKYDFTAISDTYDMFDENLFLSSGSVYYRCVRVTE